MHAFFCVFVGVWFLEGLVEEEEDYNIKFIRFLPHLTEIKLELAMHMREDEIYLIVTCVAYRGFPCVNGRYRCLIMCLI